MPQPEQNKLNKKQKEAMADALASFFFDFWQNSSNRRGNEVATLEVGSSCRGGFPTPKVAS